MIFLNILTFIQLVFFWAMLILHDLFSVECLPNQIRLGILLTEDQIEQEILFRWAIEQINSNRRSILTRTKLVGYVKRVRDGDSWDAEKRVCELLDDGAIAIIGPLNRITSHHVGSICDSLEIPNINILPRWPMPSASHRPAIALTSDLTIDLNIHRYLIAQAYIDVLKAWQWKTFVYLYESDESLIDLQEYFESNRKRGNWNIKVWRLRPDRPYREVFWHIRAQKLHNIMIDVKLENLKSVLKQAQQVSAMTENHNYFIASPDTQAIDLDDFRHGKAKIVWLKLIDHSSYHMKTLMSEVKGTESRFFDSNVKLDPERMHTDSALIYDAVDILAHSLQDADVGQSMDVVRSISCNETEPWHYGSSVVNYMRTMRLKGMSGWVAFNHEGARSGFSLNVMKLTDRGARQIGQWQHNRESVWL